MPVNNDIVFNIDTAPYTIMDQLYKLRSKDHEAFKRNAIRVAELAIQFKKTYLAYRVARELYNLGLDITHLEDYIASYGREAFYVYRFASEYKNANIPKLEDAIIRCRDIEYIARFAATIRKANVPRLEKVIQESKNSRAIYVYISYNKHADIEKFRDILIKSKRPRYLYALAKRTTDPKQLEMIGNLILAGKSNMYVRLYACNIPGADLKKCEDRIIATNSVSEFRKYIAHIPSERISKLLLLA